MYSVIAIYLLAYVVPAIVLDVLQLRYIKSYANKEPVILDKQDYKAAAKYALLSRKISILEHLWKALILVAWLSFGISYLLSALSTLGLPASIWLDLSALVCFMGINALLDLPFGLASRRLDRAFGFNKQSLGLFFADFAKGIGLGGLMLIPLFGLLLWIMSSSGFWWIAGALMFFSFIILMQLIYPTLIAPIFNRFTPLQDEALKHRIHLLLQKVGFKSSGIFVMDASRRDGRLNAYFGGLGRSKRVVLFDTLLDKISQDGLIAILGHELGHFKHGDILRNLALGGVLVFLFFALTGLCCKDLCYYMGLEGTCATVIMVSLLLLPAFGFFIQPLIGYFSRRAEYKADEFGASCVSKKALSEALLRLVNENKTFPHSHPAYVFFYFSHPPLIDRLRALEDL